MNTFITLLSIAVAAHAAKTNVHTCGGFLNVTEVEVNPTNVFSGDNISLTLKIANGYELITDGLFYFHVMDQMAVEPPQVDFLCDMVACPIRFGRSQLKLNFTVPQIRSGGYVRIEMTTMDMTQLICVEIEIEQTSWLHSLARLLLIEEPIFDRRD